MKYECLGCHKVFVYAAKHKMISATEETETYVCPFCGCANIDEIHETRRIESIQSVKINEADALLKQGYEVKDTYASSVTLVKYATPVEKKALIVVEEKPPLQERQEALDEESKRLRGDLKGFTEGGDQGRSA